MRKGGGVLCLIVVDWLTTPKVCRLVLLLDGGMEGGMDGGMDELINWNSRTVISCTVGLDGGF